MAMKSLGEKVIVLCYWNGCMKYGLDGVYYEGGPAPKKIRVEQKTKLITFLDGLYPLFGLDKQRSKFEILGKYPVAVQQYMVKYLLLPVVDDFSLETMLEVPSNHPSINNVELYLEVKSTSDDLVEPAACSSPLANQEMADKNSGLQGCLNKVSKQCLQDTSLWLDDYHELCVGLCFKDRDELKKAVDWCSIRGRRKCVVRDTEKDMYTFECVRWKCKWLLCAAKREEDGLVEITSYTGPHTCCLKVYELDFVANEIERLVRVKPTVSVAELNKWWIDKFGCEIEPHEMKNAKVTVITRVSRDEDHSFRVIPKLMSALHSSNGLLVDWRYDLLPNPEFASFNSVFWAFSQSIQGFQHCRPLIVVDTRDLSSVYQLKLMIASGVDAANKYFPLAFTVTKEVTTDSWRWFLTGIREKVTQRKGLCLISSPDHDILAVINEPGSQWKEPWAYHRFCLGVLSFQFRDEFDVDREDDYKWLMERAGYAHQKEDFDYYMNDIKERNPEARRWLDQIPPHQWALSHDGGLRYGIMEINTQALFAVCRGFSYFRLAMSGFVVLMFDELRDTFHESFTCIRDGSVYTKPVMDKLEEFMTGSVTYVITPLDRDAFQVADPSKNEEWIVQLNDSTCTCGDFQADKFPCLHALALCEKLKINPLQYVDDCYTLERYNKTYAAKFNPVPEFSAWPEASGVPTLFPPVIEPPPPKVSAKGKGKKKSRGCNC